MASWGRLVISISLVGVAACSSRSTGGPRSAAPPTPTTTATPVNSAARPATPITAPPYSFDNSVPPPAIVNTGSDYKSILQSLLDYANWAVAHRVEPSLAAKFTAPGSAIGVRYRHSLGSLRDNGERAYEVRDGDNEIRIVSRTPNVFTARVDEHIVTQLSVDRSGKVTSRRHMSGPITTYQYVVVRIGDRWYLADGSEVNTDVHL